MLSRKQKTFFKKEFYVALIGLLLGFWIWLSMFRIVQVVEGDESFYSLLVLKEAKLGDEVIFTYPNLNSPMRKSKVTKSAHGVLLISLSKELKKPLNEDLTIGVVLF